MVKLICPFCKVEIEITQSEKAKHGYKMFDNHKANCFKKRSSSGSNQAIQEGEDIYTQRGENITEVIRRLHLTLGRIPTEIETICEMERIRGDR